LQVECGVTAFIKLAIPNLSICHTFLPAAAYPVLYNCSVVHCFDCWTFDYQPLSVLYLYLSTIKQDNVCSYSQMLVVLIDLISCYFLYLFYISSIGGNWGIISTSNVDANAFLARDVIHTSRAYATMSVSVCLWRKCIGAL